MSSERVGVTSHPLYWPTGWKRTKYPEHARFNKSSVYHETQKVRAELARLGARKVIVSSNLQLRNDGIPYAGQRMPTDCGVAVWFELHEGGDVHGWKEHVLACDRWARPEHNLHAIALHIGSIRGQARWGVGTAEQAFAGFAALPEKGSGTAWWTTLGYNGDAENLEALTKPEIEKRFRELAFKMHPDRGGEEGAWFELQRAREQGLAAVAES